MNADWIEWLLWLAARSPIWLTLLIGSGLCVRHWHDQQPRSRLISVVVGLLALCFAVTNLASPLIFELTATWLGSAQLANAVVAIVFTIPFSAAMLLCFWAVFYGGDAAVQPPASHQNADA